MDPFTIAAIIGAGGSIASGILGAVGTHSRMEGPSVEEIARLGALNREAQEQRINVGEARQSRGVAAGAAASGTLNSGLAERGFGDAAANADAARAGADANVQQSTMHNLALRHPVYSMDKKGIAGQILGRVTAPATAIGLRGLIPQLLAAHGALPPDGAMGGAAGDSIGGWGDGGGVSGGTGDYTGLEGVDGFAS